MRVHLARVAAICGLFFLAASPAAAQLVVPHGQAFTITTSPNSDTAGRTNIATDGTDFVVTWKDASAQIMASRVTPDGVVVATTSTPLGRTPDSYTQPAIAFDGTNFLVVWVGSAGGVLEIYGARLSPSLQILDTPARKLTTGGAPKARPIPLAFGGGTYLTAWRTASDTIRFARITTAGEIVEGPTGVRIGGSGGRFYPWIAYGGGVFLVVYHGWGSGSLDVFGTRVAPNGTVLGPTEFTITASAHDEHHVGVASNGTDFLVEWQDRASSADLEGSTDGTRVTASGTVLDVPFRIGERSHQQGPATPVFDGTDYFVVWMTEHGRTQSSVGFRSADAYGRRVSPSGVVLDQQAVPVATSWNHQWGPTVGYANNRYLAVWHEGSQVRCGGAYDIWCVAAQLLSKESGTSPPLITPTPASGEVWVSESMGATSHLFDVYGLDDGTAFAAGEAQGGSGVPWRRYSDGAWRLWTTVLSGRLYGLWASAPSDAWATGWATMNYHYDGSTLTSSTCDGCSPAAAAPMGCAIWGGSARSMVAVGVNGFAWQFVPAAAPPFGWRVTSTTGTTFDLWDVWGTSPSNVYAVGERGTILRYNGTRWSQETGVPTFQSLNGIWGTSPTDIYAVGDYGTILHFDGTSWTPENSGTLEHLHGIWGLRPNEIYAVGYGGTVLHFDGTTWLHDTSPTTADLYDVWGSAVTGTLWAVGRGGVVFKKTGAGAGCSFTTGPAPGPFGQAGGTTQVEITTACTWTAYSQVPWISVTSGASGTGAGTVSLSVDPNALTTSRSGTIAVAGSVITIVQAGSDDADHDGLLDTWEGQLGLNPAVATGDDGPDGDPDHDGQTNLAEYQAGTHPRGFFTRYFAEGATGALFDYWVALLNPGTTVAHVNVRFLKRVGGTVSHVVAVPGMSRRTVVAKQVPGVETADAVSTVVESDELIVADRTMSWDANGYGGHAETSIASPAQTWYLAEGATHSGFDLFYLIQNPNTTAVTVRVTYLRPTPLPPILKDYVVAANSRFNIWVDLEEFPSGSGNRTLAQTDVSAILQSTDAAKPIIVERAMYLSLGQEGQPEYQFFGAGHDSAGVTAPATSWFLAEGATGSYFDLYILLANPGAVGAGVMITYLLPNGTTVQLAHTVAPYSRKTVFVNAEHPVLADTPVSAVVTSDQPIIVERAMWWPGPTWATWFEAHNSPGALVTGTKWAVADVEHSGTKGTETYILIANTSPFAGQAKVTLVFEDGSPPQESTLNLAANSRTTTYWLKTGGARQRFSAIVESVGATPAQIVVERAMYWDALGVHWAAGTNALGTKLQ